MAARRRNEARAERSIGIASSTAMTATIGTGSSELVAARPSSAPASSARRRAA